MDLNNLLNSWKVQKIGVIGPGIVGMPMAALFANARIKIGTEVPAKVIVVQRNSQTSGWKVDSINAGKSVIGGIEPELDEIVKKTVSEGILNASYSYNDLSDADVILICVQTDKKGFAPDYDPLFEALKGLVEALQKKPKDKLPLIIFESTLAPSSMRTLIKDFFKKYNLIEGKDILLGNSPNRVMPGRLVERIRNSDKIIAGMNPITVRLIKKLYSNVVTNGTLLETNSFTAEIVKTLENAYRDVRIALSSEVVRYCDNNDINFYNLRDKVNEKLVQSDSATSDPNAVPTGGMLIPTIGVGGHCLPKDGILLWWRKIESDSDTSESVIIKSREINNKSPHESLKLAETKFGSLQNKKISLLGAAYRFNSEDTRNSPTLSLAGILKEKKYNFKIHDPFVKQSDQNLIKNGLGTYFTNNLDEALIDAEVLIFCTAHKIYKDSIHEILDKSPSTKYIFDGCNLFNYETFSGKNLTYTGIGRGKDLPSEDLINQVFNNFQSLEKKFANEIKMLAAFFNDNYVDDDFNTIHFKAIQKLAGTCTTGCNIVDPDEITKVKEQDGFISQLLSITVKPEEKASVAEL